MLLLFSVRLLALGLGEHALVFSFALVFRRAGFTQRDRDGLLAALDPPAPPTAPDPKRAMLEFMHDATSPLALAGRSLRHCASS
jgi:hypothetical protein